MRKGFSIKSKLVLILLLISLFSILTIGFLSWRSNHAIVESLVMTELEALRQSKAEQLEGYFQTMRNQVEVLSEDEMIVNAMIAFNRSFRGLSSQSISPQMSQGLEAFYTTQFFPKLFATLPGQAEYARYRPGNPAGVYLQYHYIAANPYTNDIEKSLLDQAEDGSDYSAEHANYHPRLRTIANRLGFDDLILINYESGDVVYTVAKQTEFASNLLNGPYRKSNQTTAFELVRTNPDRGNVNVVDFELYRPGYGIPSSFWSVPIYNGTHIIGILLVQISLAEVNKLMTYNQSWPDAGLGQTGESYLVGQDLLMRSNARAFIETPADYLTGLQADRVPERTRNLIEKLNTTVLFQRINSFPVREALLGRAGTQLTTDHYNRPIIASYQPLTLETLQWALVTEIEQAEAYAPIYDFQNTLLIAVVVMMTLCTFAALVIANNFLRPVKQVIEGTRQVSNGEYATQLKIEHNDELGELAQGFNRLAETISQQNLLTTAQQQQNEQLWLALLPESLAQRAQKGTTSGLLEEAQQVSILTAQLRGFHELTAGQPATVVARLLQTLSLELDEAATQQDVERLAAAGQQWLGLCGLSRSYLDHSRRVVEFALAAQQIVTRFNQNQGTKLQLSMGIERGAVTAGAIGSPRLVTELWGEAVKVAADLRADADPNTTLVSQAVYEQLQGHYNFRRYAKTQRDTTRPVAWVLEGTKS